MRSNSFKNNVAHKLFTYESCLVWFYGIATIVGYLMPNSVFTYVFNKWLVNTFRRYTQLNDQTVLFVTIQFSICKQS